MWTPFDSVKKYYNKAKGLFLDEGDDESSPFDLDVPVAISEPRNDTGEDTTSGTGYSSTTGDKGLNDTDKLVTKAGIAMAGADALAGPVNTSAPFVSAGSTIKDAIDIAAPIVQTAAGVAGAIDYNNTMRYMSDQTNATNKAIADQNLAFQRENFDYTKALQQKIFDREDSSYQRTVADMRAAGMSPLVMNGTNSAGEAIATTPMNNQYQHTQPLDYKSPFDALNGITNIISNRESLRTQRLQNDYLQKTLDDRVAQQRAQTLASSYNSLDASRKEQVNKYFGINSSMSEKERYACIISKILGNPLINSDGSPNQNFDINSLLKSLKNYRTQYGLENIADALAPESVSAPSKVAEKVANSDKKDIYGNSNSQTDKKILEKAKKGENLNPFEQFILWLNTKGIK